jgi:methylated-DNA-[protein]-cysteine S-methyltransferase
VVATSDGPPQVVSTAPARFVTDRIGCALGTIVLMARDGRLSSLDYLECHDRMMTLLTARYGAVEVVAARDPFGFSTRVRAYLAGDIAAIDEIPIDPGGTRFQQRVWATLRRIPAGTKITYSDLARAIGHPNAIRAAGAANARNAVAIVVPCHRVVGRDGSLTGYAGGLWRKRWLLGHEGRWVAARAEPVSALL